MSTTAQRLAEYEDLYRKAQAYDPNAFQNEFEKSYGEATNYNKDLIEQQAQALGEVQAVAPTLREKYMNTLISDPSAQMALIAQARQAPIQSYGTAANLLTARGQRYQDILGKALGGYQTSASQANTAAENAWRLYQDAVQQDQFNRQLRASRGGGGGAVDLLADRNGNGIPDIFERGGEQDTTGGDTTGGETYEIPEGGIAIKDGLIDLQNDSLGSGWKNRLTNEVLKQRQATGFKDVLKAYTQSQLEPLRNIKTFNDVISIPSRVVGVNTVTTADLIRRLFKK